MAADKGNATAMYNYAIMLKKGDGIEVNKSEAAHYFKMAAHAPLPRCELVDGFLENFVKKFKISKKIKTCGLQGNIDL